MCIGRVAFLLLVVLSLLLSSLSGCGGGGSSSSLPSGRAVFTVLWPAPSRLIPAAANSLRVEMLQDGVVVADQLLPRPPGPGPATLTFDNLPVRTLVARATAYPQANGTGTAQASGSVLVVIQAGQTVPFALTMGSTIERMELMPPNTSLMVNESVQLTATARDGAGSVVLTAPSKLQWSSSSGAASVDGTGKVTALTGGTATITVTDQESGKSAAATITVGSSQSVNVTIPGTSNPWLAGMPDGTDGGSGDSAPAQSPVLVNMTVTPGQTLTFTATGLVGHNGSLENDAEGDPGYLTSRLFGPLYNIGDMTGPLNALVGVFLGPERPDLSGAPPALDFSTPVSRNFITFSPSLKQVFFIGNGRDDNGTAQRFVVPSGATRFYLAIMDGYDWNNNVGAFDVQVQRE